MTTLPTQADLIAMAEDTAARCGVDLAAHRGDHVAISPVNGQRLSTLSWATAEDVQPAIDRAQEAVSYTHLTLPTNREV